MSVGELQHFIRHVVHDQTVAGLRRELIQRIVSFRLNVLYRVESAADLRQTNANASFVKNGKIDFRLS